MKNYASYVEEGLLKDLESPFTDIIEQSIIGSNRFVDKIKREYLFFVLATRISRARPGAFAAIVFSRRNNQSCSKRI